MCEPTTIIMGMSLAMGAASAYQQYQMGKYNAAVARNQAIAQKYQAETQAQRLESDADSVLESGWAAERQKRIETARMMGGQRAAFAGSGVELSDTALGVVADTKMEGEREALTIRSNAARQAYGMQMQAGDARYAGQTGYDAGMADSRMSSWSGTFGAGTTMLGSATDSYVGYHQMKAAGIGGKKSGGSAPTGFTDFTSAAYQPI